MAGIKTLVGLSFAAAMGLMFLFLGCALPGYEKWWPLFILFFYVLSPIPYIMSRRYADSYNLDSSSNACAETSIFVTCILVISAFGLPVVLAHTQAIAWGACALVFTGNLIMFATIGVAFFLFTRDDFDYSSW